MICCAKCHFHPFLPFSSISQPPSWKMLPSQKTPENSTLRAFCHILPAYDTKRSHFRHCRTKIRKMQIKIDGPKNGYVVCYALHVLHFLINNHSLHYSKHHLPIIVNLIYYHYLHYSYYINYSIIHKIIFTTIISILQYCYSIVTIL